MSADVLGARMDTLIVYRPTADVVGAEGAAISSRLRSLNGSTIGLLWNSKVNADVYLRRLQALLSERNEDVSFVWQRKPSSSKPMQEEDLEALQECDAVVTAFGD